MHNESNIYKSKFKKLLIIQVALISIALLAFIYISSEASKELKEYKMIKAMRDEAEREYNELKANIEKLYSVRVTPQNEVYELKATARATGRNYPDGKPIYNFSIYINSPPELLDNVRKVTYDFDHPTFTEPHQEATDPGTKFATHYSGWGCLRKVKVKVFLRDNTEQSIDFNMCKSIGWE